jgi:tetratricopeptide (TPR) repeat protein
MSAAVLTPTPLESARHHHAQGDLLQAAKAYRETLQSHPQSQAALLGLSILARQSNQLQPALHMAQAALAAKSESAPSSAVAWANLGDTLAALHQTIQAEPIFRHALKLDPNFAAAHYGLGNCLALRNDYPAALLSFQIAAQLVPNIPEFHFAQAFAQGQLGAHPQAIAAYRCAVTLRPGFASAWLNLGVELIADGRDNLAHLCYREALAASANIPNTQISTHLNLGHLARSRHNFPQAEEHYNTALAIASQSNPTSHPNPADRLAEIQVAFTYLHLEQKHFPQAWQSLAQAEAAQATSNPEIPNARGILLLAEEAAQPMRVPQVSTLRPGRDADPGEPLQQAIAAFHQAESQGHKTAASNRGNALLRLGRCQDALAAHQAAAAANPHHPGVLYNLALTQLRLGDYAQGWPNYEIRWSFREVHPHPRRFRQPRWQGEPLPENSSLLIYAEQGLGDTLQFVRYLPQVNQRLPAAYLILEVQPPLARLLAAQFPKVQVIAHGDLLPSFTHHCPLMSLPAIFQTTLATVLNQTPYLHPDPELVQARTAELSLIRPTIGISWAGNPNYRADHERSTRLETFLPLLKIPNIQWISLQKGEAANQIPKLPPEIHLYDGSSQDRDLADTTALVANLDLVITTDTAVAHLAGALGKPLWLLLPWQSDWRWMQDRPDTPWYPTARLFRQSSPNNWPELINRVARELPSTLANLPPSLNRSR